MALKPPHPNVEHPPLGEIPEDAVRELARKVQQNQDYFARQFPLTTNLIVNEIIVTKKIAEEAITTDKLQAESITAEKIKAGTITATQIEAHSITADKLEVEKLSAISANLGEVTAGTIIGNTIKTAASGARVEIDSLGIRGINAAAVEKFHFDTTTGILTATAVISAEEGSEIPTEVLAGQIKETQIEEGAISTPLLQANAVTAEKISVSKLAAISADLGEVTAGTITGITIKAVDAFLLNASTASESAEEKNALRWLNAENKRQAEVFGATFAAGSVLRLYANQLEEKEIGEVQLKAWSSGGKEAWIAPLAGSTQSVNAKAGSEQNVLVSSTGEISFPRLTTNAKRKINFGSTKVKWGSKAVASTGKSVTHSIGTTPSSVTAIGGSFVGSYAEVASVGATTFEVRLVSTTGEIAEGTERTVYWLAIG